MFALECSAKHYRNLSHWWNVLFWCIWDLLDDKQSSLYKLNFKCKRWNFKCVFADTLNGSLAWLIHKKVLKLKLDIYPPAHEKNNVFQIQRVCLNVLINSLYLPIMLIIRVKEFSRIYIFLILKLMQYLEYNYVLVCCALLANFLCFEVSRWLCLIFHYWWPLQTGRLRAN